MKKLVLAVILTISSFSAAAADIDIRKVIGTPPPMITDVITCVGTDGKSFRAVFYTVPSTKQSGMTVIRGTVINGMKFTGFISQFYGVTTLRSGTAIHTGWMPTVYGTTDGGMIDFFNTKPMKAHFHGNIVKGQYTGRAYFLKTGSTIPYTTNCK